MISAAAPMVSTASSTPTPQIELSTAAAAAALTADDQETEFAVVTWKRGRHYQVNIIGPEYLLFLPWLCNQ